MDAVEVLLNRRSCRSFEDRPVSDEDINTIVQCGLNAPSGTNKQDTKIIIVKDPIKVKELSDLSKQLTNSKTDTFYGAKALLMVIAPFESGYDVKYYQRNPMKNAALVMGNMLNAAYAIGVGACWINTCEQVLESERGKQILSQLGLDENEYYGIGFCILGYPKMTLGKKKIKENRIFTL